MPEHAGPILYLDVTDLLQHSLTVLLPKGTSVGMSIQCEHEDNDWVLILGIPATVEPLRRPLPGNLLEVSDGESAYTQARLKGKKTWVRIPRDQ